MSDRLLIYGATGYTGRLITADALALSLRPTLAGRNEARLDAVAGPLGLEYRVARLDDPQRLTAALEGMQVVLHAAGPFSATSRPMVEACLRTRTHYLDITGEMHVIEALALRHAEARARQIMIMPGVGFDVVPSDCLAVHVARRLPGAQRLALGFRGLNLTTRGSAKTIIEFARYAGQVRRQGVLTTVPSGFLERRFDYGDGTSPSVSVSWGDLAAAYYSTGIPNIEVYFEATPWIRAMLLSARYFGRMVETAPWQAWLKAQADLLPEGPTAERRAGVEMVIMAEADDGSGRQVRARLRTPEAYTFTGRSAAAIAKRVLAGDLEHGFQTPGRHYGGDFVLSFAGVSREDLG